MDLNGMISKIAEEKGMEEEEIRERIEKKQRELGGLITPEGAVHVVANELGMNLFEGVSKPHALKIENVIPGMNRVDLSGRVLRIYEAREFEKKDGSAGRVASLTLGDETGRIRVVFWGDAVGLIEGEKIIEGDVLEIKEAYSRETVNGEAEIHMGARSRLKVNPKGVKVASEDEAHKTLSELKEGLDGVDVVGRVLRIYQPRGFAREDGTKGRVANLVIGDASGKARVVLWDDDVSLVEGGEIAVGDVLKIKKGYVRSRYGEMEVNVGRYGKVVLNPPKSEGVPEIGEFEDGSSRKEIGGLKKDEGVEVRGAILEVYEFNPVYKREGGAGIVLNALLDDGSGEIRAVFFNRLAELLLDASASGLAEAEDPVEFIRRAKPNLIGREIVVSGKVKYNKTYDRYELIASDLDLNPDPKREFNALLKTVKHIVGE